MFVCRSGDILRVDAPAKINLFLEVIARRSDGFHDIETLMVPVSLFDTLLFRSTSSTKIALDCQWAKGHSSDAAPLPNPSDNLVTKALQQFAQQANVLHGAELKLIKRIPSEAGLGGASSDAAAALLAANVGWNVRWPIPKLAEIAANLGSDIPFFLYGTAAVCCGRGEQIAPLATFPKVAIVVVKPPAGLSTPEVYRRCQVTTEPVTAQALLDGVRQGDVYAMAAGMKNDLAPPASELCPWIDKVSQEFDRLPFIGHQMSGSGTSYFGICRNVRHARRLACALRGRRVGRVIQTATGHHLACAA